LSLTEEIPKGLVPPFGFGICTTFMGDGLYLCCFNSLCNFSIVLSKVPFNLALVKPSIPGEAFARMRLNASFKLSLSIAIL
jgi:hypothetical protein